MIEQPDNLWKWGTTDFKARLQRLEDAAPRQLKGKTYAKRVGGFRSVGDNLVTSDGSLDLSASSYAATGALPPTVADGAFAATATTTSITWYWDGTNGSTVFKLRRADALTQTGNQTCLVVPGGSITVTGLTANTKYYFLPFWPTRGGCGVSWVIGDTGSPMIAHATLTAANLALQSLKDRESLSAGAMSYTTPAAGTSSGGASDGGGTGTGGVPRCVMTGTAVEPLGESPYRVEIYPETEWVGLQTVDLLSLNCTIDHPLYRDDADTLSMFVAGRDLETLTENELAPWRVNAVDLKVGDYVLTKLGVRRLIKAERFLRVCTKRSVHMDSGHLFWANGFMSHNVKVNVN